MAARSIPMDRRARAGSQQKARRTGAGYRVRTRGPVPDDLCDRVSAAHASAIRRLREGSERPRNLQSLLRSGAQSCFLRDLTNEMVADDLKKKLLAQYTGQTVSREELETFTAWHPIALSRRRTSALTQLQGDGILELIPPARRPGEFPRGSAVRFA